jgi:hypothetical protein
MAKALRHRPEEVVDRQAMAARPGEDACRDLMIRQPQSAIRRNHIDMVRKELDAFSISTTGMRVRVARMAGSSLRRSGSR